MDIKLQTKKSIFKRKNSLFSLSLSLLSLPYGLAWAKKKTVKMDVKLQIKKSKIFFFSNFLGSLFLSFSFWAVVASTAWAKKNRLNGHQRCKIKKSKKIFSLSLSRCCLGLVDRPEHQR